MDKTIKVSLDGGVTYQEAKDGVRVIYEDVVMTTHDGKEIAGELHINHSAEGVVEDFFGPDLGAKQENFINHGTGWVTIDDIVARLK